MSHLYLLGFMGSGKSVLGERVARRAGRPFVDLDAEVERAAGATVAAIFAERGERAFREAESAALRGLAGHPPAVVATGGGPPERRENREFLLNALPGNGNSPP